MKNTRALLSALLILGALPGLAPAQPKPDAAPPATQPAGALDAETSLGAAVTEGNLTVIPLLATGAVDASRYLTLDEGMGKGLVAVREDGGGSVNTLIVENRGDLPLFLLSGEVIIGGKQDRIIGKETVVGPKETAGVPVFCVEHGRWTEAGDGKSFRSAKALAHSKLRRDAAYRGQGQVWDEVAKTNAAKGTQSDTDTYRAVATGKTDASIAAYAKTIGPALDKAAAGGKLVGVVLAVNGKVVAVERFRAPGLFAQLRGKLLRSYYLDAAALPLDAAAAAKAPGAPEIAAFLTADKEAATQVVFDEDGYAGEQVRAKGKKGSRVRDKAAPAAARPVYENVQADEDPAPEPIRAPRIERLPDVE